MREKLQHVTVPVFLGLGGLWVLPAMPFLWSLILASSAVTVLLLIAAYRFQTQLRERRKPRLALEFANDDPCCYTEPELGQPGGLRVVHVRVRNLSTQTIEDVRVTFEGTDPAYFHSVPFELCPMNDASGSVRYDLPPDERTYFKVFAKWHDRIDVDVMARHQIGDSTELPKLQITGKICKVIIAVTGKDVGGVMQKFAVWLDPIQGDLNFDYWDKRAPKFVTRDRPIEMEDFMKLFPSDFK